jgi:hypothetical protein
VGLLDREGEFLVFMMDSRRFEPFRDIGLE